MSVLNEIVDIAALPGAIGQRAQALLEPLRRVTPCDAVFITAFDPERRVQTPLLRYGYTASVDRALDGPQLTTDLELAGLQGPCPPMQIRDLAVPVEILPTWSQHLYPAGIRECLGTGLFTRDGRYLGVVNTNSSDPRPADGQACALLARAAPWIAHAIDPLRTPATIAAMVEDAVAGVVLTRAGDTVALPGLPGHVLLAAGSPLLTAAAARLAVESLATFLCPSDPTDPDCSLMRVRVMACPPTPPGHLCAVVMLTPPPHLCEMTSHELRILGLLLAGWSRARIAAALGGEVRAVAGQVEHILTKLRAANRHVAAVRALRRGLYIPAEITTAAGSAG